MEFDPSHGVLCMSVCLPTDRHLVDHYKVDSWSSREIMNSRPESEEGAGRWLMSPIDCGDERLASGPSQGAHGDSSALTDSAPTSESPEEAARGG